MAAEGPDLTLHPTQLAQSIWTSYNLRERTLLTVGALAAYWIFVSIGSMFSIPRVEGYQGSLMLLPNPLVALLVTGVVLVACVALTSLFAGTVYFEAGLFCAAIGMIALSIRGGPMRYVLMASPGNAIFPRLLAELIVLFAFVGLAWATLVFMQKRGLLRGEPHGEADPDSLPAQGAMALVAQTIIMIFLMIILTQADKKAQVVWSVLFSSLLAAMAAHSIFPSRPSSWFLVAPLIVGVIGYVFAWAGGNNLPGGAVGGYAPALARPLPLDYAAMGTAGALFGYWTSRHWEHERNREPEEPEQVEDALEHPPQNA